MEKGKIWRKIGKIEKGGGGGGSLVFSLWEWINAISNNATFSKIYLQLCDTVNIEIPSTAPFFYFFFIIFFLSIPAN